MWGIFLGGITIKKLDEGALDCTDGDGDHSAIIDDDGNVDNESN